MPGRLAVVGGGLAGTMAALEARRIGAEVTLVSNSPGRMAVSCGLIGLADPPRPKRPAFDSETLRDDLEALIRHNPLHPYAQFDDLPASLCEAVSRFLAEVSDLYPADFDRNAAAKFLPNELGSLTRARLAPESLASLAADDHVNKRIVLAGLSGCPRFRPVYLAGMIRQCAKRLGLDLRIEAVSLPFDREGRPFGHPAHLAKLLDDDERLKRLADGIKDALTDLGSNELWLPSVLGFRRHDRAALLSGLLGVAVGEVAAGSMAVFGLRLARLLNGRIEKAGITQRKGRVTGFRADGGRITALEIERKDGLKEELPAEAVVLASGRYFGGGILFQNRRIIEPIFKLPVFVKQRLTRDAFIGRLADPDFFAAQRFMQAGVRVDERGLALGENGEPAYENLFAAGQVLGGFDPATDGSAEGVDLVTGLRAGRFAAEAAS